MGNHEFKQTFLQDDGRKARGVDPDQPTPLLKFEVSAWNDAVTPIGDGTVIRGIRGEDPGGRQIAKTVLRITGSGKGQRL